VKLRRWHRAGIVASIGWILYASTSERLRHADLAYSIGRATFDACIGVERRPFNECSEEQHRQVQEFMATQVWKSVAAGAVLPVILTWLLVGLGLWVFRWIMSGDR